MTVMCKSARAKSCEMRADTSADDDYTAGKATHEHIGR